MQAFVFLWLNSTVYYNNYCGLETMPLRGRKRWPGTYTVDQQ